MPGGSRQLKELTVGESLHLLASVPLGRVVFTHRALPAIRPVNHIVDRGDVIIRTHLGAALLSAAGPGVVVAYQADSIDPQHRLGWSVIVTGFARLVTDPEQVDLYHQRLRPWVEQPSMEQVIRIQADLVTGFELLPAPPCQPLADEVGQAR